MDEQEISEHYREMDVVEWFRTHRGPHTLDEVVGELDCRGSYWDELAQSENWIRGAVTRLSAESLRINRVGENIFAWEDCPQCGSSAPYGGCDLDCYWDRCPGPQCDFVGDMREHVEEAGSNPGYTGASIYWVNFRCGYQEWDASADNVEAAR